MGLKDWFKGGSSDPVDKWRKRLTQKWGPSENRMAAMDKLVDMGSPEAIRTLLDRFTIQSENGVIDETEKGHVGDAILNFGVQAIEPIRQALREIDQISWPLALLRQILSEDEERFITEFVALLDDLDVEYIRNPEKKLALMTFLANLDELDDDEEPTDMVRSARPPVDERIAAAAVKFLEDEDEEVRFLTVTALARQGDEVAREPLIALLIDEDASRRFRMLIAEAFSKTEWTVKGYRRQAEEALPQGFKLDRQGRVKDRRG
jgi:HEAT repeat protein